MTEEKESILLVEDNEDLARVLELHLRDLGYDFKHALDGEEGLSLALSGDYALVILDRGLPKMDGFQVLAEIRKVQDTLPVLVLTSKSDEIDKVVGLNLGADDYVTKPFNVAELLARINALLRRVKNISQVSLPVHKTTLCFDELSIDPDSRRVTLKEKEVDLTTMEYDILVFLATHAGQAFSRDELLESIWQYDAGNYAHTVNNMIMRIRKKIEEDPANPRYIKTIRGFGYRFSEAKEL